MSDTNEVGAVGWMDLTVPDAPALRDFYSAAVGGPHPRFPSAKIRAKVVPVLLPAALVLGILLLIIGRPLTSAGLLGFGLLTALADFVIDGVKKKTFLFGKIRELAFTSPPGDWLMAFAGFALILAILVVFKLFWVAIVVGVAAVGLAFALHVTLDRKAKAERAESIASVETMLRTLRLQGLEENAVRQFVCKYTGNHWEELFETLFGYEAKLDARARWGRGERAKPRPKYASWRDPLVAWVDAKVKARRESKERSKLEKIEEKGLQAQGENLVTARRKARRAAKAMVTMASEAKRSQAATRRDHSLEVNHNLARAIREAANQPEKVLVGRESGLIGQRRKFNPIDLILGQKPRFLAGVALIAACLFWMNQNQMLSTDQARVLIEAAKEGDVEAAKVEAKARLEQVRATPTKATKPIDLPLLPKPFLALLSSFGAGGAGLFLVFSSFFRGSKIALFAIPAAAVTLIGPKLGLPTFGKIDPSLVPLTVGGAIMAVGVLWTEPHVIHAIHITAR